ncbi:MAG: glycosyltransferase 87 family protein [Candidatus Aureabacteria bacterium]|nr:glycosyltransferase 87 family protein [Candidatus Auribacterota bacterium]
MATWWFRKFLGALLILYCAGLAHYLLSRPDAFQWDFRVYYEAGRAYLRGANPYDATLAAGVEGYAAPRGFRFYYPPVVLPLLGILASRDYTTALQGVFIFKCALLIGLIYLWGREFLPGKPDLLFFLFCLVAFNGCIYIDFKAGNVSVIEQFSLWLGFYFFLKRRLLLFCILIICSSLFKVTPLVFLGMLFFSGDTKKYVWAWVSAGAVVLATAASYIFNPVLFTRFMLNAGRVLDRTIVMSQPSTFDLLEDLIRMMKMNMGRTLSSGVHLAVFGVLVAVVLIVTVRRFIMLRSLDLADREKIMIFMACTVYAMVMPNFEDYEYIILIVPAYWILKRSGDVNFYLLFFAFTLFSSVLTPLPLIRPLVRIIIEYSPLVLAYLMWGAYLREVAHECAASGACGSGENKLGTI